MGGWYAIVLFCGRFVGSVEVVVCWFVRMEIIYSWLVSRDAWVAGESRSLKVGDF